MDRKLSRSTCLEVKLELKYSEIHIKILVVATITFDPL